MKSHTSFEIFRWVYYFLLWFIGTGFSVIIIELIAGPFLQWLFYDIPYSLPSWNRAGRMALLVLFIGFWAGTISWYYEKRVSGR